jgi:hypothetical protein
MIVRISTEGQYRLDDDHHDQLNELDNAVVAACEGNEESGFRDRFSALLEYVRSNGVAIGDDEIETSDLILPPADTTLAEAREEFTGEGLIPD